MRGSFLAILVAVAGLSGCGGPLGGECEDCGGANGDGAKIPYGSNACVARYFSDFAAECTASDCGEAMSCWTDPDCASCSDRCMPAECFSASDCVSAYEGLCESVIWRCEGNIVGSNKRCLPVPKANSYCNDGSCDSTEACGECIYDCGYCPGTAPLLAPCIDHSECASGWCLGTWCSDYCETPEECDTNPDRLGECGETDEGEFACFPRCGEGKPGQTIGCPEYPGTQCFAATRIDGMSAKMCAFL